MRRSASFLTPDRVAQLYGLAAVRYAAAQFEPREEGFWPVAADGWCANTDPLPPIVNCDTFGDATFVAFRDGE